MAFQLLLLLTRKFKFRCLDYLGYQILYAFLCRSGNVCFSKISSLTQIFYFIFWFLMCSVSTGVWWLYVFHRRKMNLEPLYFIWIHWDYTLADQFSITLRGMYVSPFMTTIKILSSISGSFFLSTTLVKSILLPIVFWNLCWKLLVGSPTSTN